MVNKKHTSLNMTIVDTLCSETIRQKSVIVFGIGSCVIMNPSELSYAVIIKKII